MRILHRRAVGKGFIASIAVLGALTMTAVPAFAVSVGQSTAGPPRIAYMNGTMYVGWTGTDSANHINIGQVGYTTDQNVLGLGAITTLSDTALPNTGPALGVATVNGSTGDQLIVAWAGTDSGHHIYIGRYNGHGIDCHTALPESTNRSPYIIGSGSNIYLVWTGADAAGHVNIALLNTNSCPSHITLQTVVTLSDTANAGPAITFLNGNLYVAWPGTDENKHIYIGEFTGGPTLANHTCLCSLSSINDLGMSSNDANVITIAYAGVDSGVYLAHLQNGTSLYDNQADGNNSTVIGGDITDVPVGNGDYPGGQYNIFAGTDDQLNIDWHVYALPPG